jgi:hypothetical protein
MLRSLRARLSSHDQAICREDIPDWAKKSRIKAERRTNDHLSHSEEQAQIAEEVRRWRRRAAYLGVGLIVSVLLWTPFFEGGPLHRFWSSFGRMFAVLSMIFFLLCLYSAATMVNRWLYGANLRRIDRQFATGAPNRKKGHR